MMPIKIAFTGDRFVGKTTLTRRLSLRYSVGAICDLGLSGLQDPYLSMFTMSCYMYHWFSNVSFISDRWITDVLCFTRSEELRRIGLFVLERAYELPKLILIHVYSGSEFDKKLAPFLQAYSGVLLTIPSLPREDQVISLFREIDRIVFSDV